MNSRHSARLAATARSSLQRHSLAYAIVSSLFAASLSPAAMANEPEQRSRTHLDAVKARLPDLTGASAHQGEEGAAGAEQENADETEPATLARDTSAQTSERTALANQALMHLMAAGNGGGTDSLVSGLVNQGLQTGVGHLGASGLPFLGRLQGGVTYDHVTGKLSFDAVTLGTLAGNGSSGHHLLGQVGGHNQVDRPTANLGLIYRWINPTQDLMFGGNLFYDRDFKTGAERLGAGVEAATGSVRAFSNLYAPLSDRWYVSPEDDEIEERAASGVDVGLAYSPARLPALDLQLTGSRWDGQAVDVFGTGQTERDPTVYSAKIGYSPVPLISLSLEQSRVSGGEQDTQLMLQFNYQFGTPMAQQLKASAGRHNDVTSRLLEPVERQKRMVMETRDRYAAPPMFANPMVRTEILEGKDHFTPVVVSGGTPQKTYALSGLDAGLFVLAAGQLHLTARDYDKPTDSDGDNLYEVTVTVTDSRGRSAHQQVQIVILPDLTDTDGDGLTDKNEGAIGTDPTNPDTDTDGLTDGAEVEGGTDPLDPNDPGLGVTRAEVRLNGAPIQGHPIVGQTLSVHLICRDGSEACASSAQYQWTLETEPGSGQFADIPGATQPTYTPVRTDQRRAIRVTVRRH
jgi:hypothetical protein